MEYLQVTDRVHAETRSRDAWLQILGRPINPEDTTRYFFPIVRHPTTGLHALAVRDAKYRSALTALERAELKTRAQMRGAGWEIN